MTLERMMDIIAQFESNGDFGAWNPNDNGRGISFGKFQFSQRGGLHGLLVRMHKADPKIFSAKFGAQGSRELLDRNTLLKMNLNDGRWKVWFQSAAHVPIFQRCQLEEAVESYAKPAANLCQEHGLKSFLWLALVTDSCVQYGVGGCKRLLKQALENPGINGTMDTFAELADDNEYNRRRKLLVHPELVDRAAFVLDSERWHRFEVSWAGS